MASESGTGERMRTADVAFPMNRTGMELSAYALESLSVPELQRRHGWTEEQARHAEAERSTLVRRLQRHMENY